MEKKRFTKKKWINRHVLMARLRVRWSFLVWLMAAGLAVFVYFHGGRFGGMTGAVFTRSQNIAPLTTARIETLLVDVGDAVRAGELLGRMDASMIEAERDLVAAQMDNMVAEVEAEEVQNLRRFDASILELASELRALRLALGEAERELSVLRPEVERMERLFEQRLIDEQELISLRTDHASLNAIVEIYPAAIVELEASLAEAHRQKDEISVRSRNSIQLIRQEAARQNAFFAAQIEACNLRAQSDGTVSRIYAYPGDTVTEGLPVIATVVSEPIQQVVGFLSEYNARDVQVGMKAFLTSQFGHGPVVEARVVALTPEIYRLPYRATPSVEAEQEARGRRAVLEITSESHLLPGESVHIFFHRPWRLQFLGRFFTGKTEGSTP